MKNIGGMTDNELLFWAVRRTDCIRMFHPTKLPDAARAKLSAMLKHGYFDIHLTMEQSASLAATVGTVNPVWVSPQINECRYSVFGDGSLMLASSVVDQVWADASDFVDEQVSPYIDAGREADEIDAALVRFLANK